MAVGSLERLDLFAGCTAQERERAGRLLQSRTFGAGDVIIESGEGDRRLLIVVRGQVVVTTPQGVEGRLGPGDILGEIALLDDVVHSASVTAATDTDVLVADPAAFERLRQIGDVGRRLRAVADARSAVAGRSIVEASSVAVFVRPPRVMGRGAGLVARADRRHRPVRLVVAGVVALGVIGAAAFLVVGNASTPVGLDDVMARYAATPDVALGAQPTGGTPSSPVAPTSSDAAEPAPQVATENLTAPIAVTRAAAPATEPVAGAPSTPVAATPGGTTDPAPAEAEAARAYGRPAAGVYAYATTGGESISVPNGDHRYPSETYAGVRHGAGCDWSVEHWVLEEHTESHQRCSEPGRVLAIEDGRVVSFFGKSQDTTYRCDPPAVLLRDDVAPGFEGEATCRADNGDTATYRGTFVGLEERRIGGQAVSTQHVRLHVTIDGSARGTSTVDFWLDAATGLVVREERSTRADVDSELGSVRYTEDATFELLSLTPRR